MTVFGFHCGVGGNSNGIGTHWHTLDAARIPAFLKSVDSYVSALSGESILGPPNGQVDERYWCANGLGLVRWQKYSGQRSWIHELIPVGSHGNNVKEVGCYS